MPLLMPMPMTARTAWVVVLTLGVCAALLSATAFWATRAEQRCHALMGLGMTAMFLTMTG